MIDIEAIWDYNDPAGSEQRFLSALKTTSDPGDALEIRTQIARTYSLRRQVDQSHEILDEVEASSLSGYPRAQLRYLLERGRAFNTGGQKDQARPLFLEAVELGNAKGEGFLAADAAHMVAFIAEGQEALDWNLRTIEIARASTDPAAKKWIATAANNSGWTYFSSGRFEEALAQFELALDARQGGPADRILIARWCVARGLRSVGQVQEALSAQLDLKSDRDKIGQPGGFVFEEIGECLILLGRDEEAKPYFARAYELLSADPWLPADEPARLERLALLAGL